MARIIVNLTQQEQEALSKLADREYRDPRSQAALLIRRELEREKFLAPAPGTVGSDCGQGSEAERVAR